MRSQQKPSLLRASPQCPQKQSTLHLGHVSSAPTLSQQACSAVWATSTHLFFAANTKREASDDALNFALPMPHAKHQTKHHTPAGLRVGYDGLVEEGLADDTKNLIASFTKRGSSIRTASKGTWGTPDACFCAFTMCNESQCASLGSPMSARLGSMPLLRKESDFHASEECPGHCFQRDISTAESLVEMVFNAMRFFQAFALELPGVAFYTNAPASPHQLMHAVDCNGFTLLFNGDFKYSSTRTFDSTDATGREVGSFVDSFLAACDRGHRVPAVFTREKPPGPLLATWETNRRLYINIQTHKKRNPRAEHHDCTVSLTRDDEYAYNTTDDSAPSPSLSAASSASS